jgi:hypothetical protein
MAARLVLTSLLHHGHVTPITVQVSILFYKFFAANGEITKRKAGKHYEKNSAD